MMVLSHSGDSKESTYVTSTAYHEVNKADKTKEFEDQTEENYEEIVGYSKWTNSR